MKRYFRLFLASTLLFLNIAVTLPVSAHDGEDHNQSKPAEVKAETPAFSGYEFVTPANCSLSLLTRRALQLYDEANDQVTLSQASAMFAETNIVNHLGGRQLEVGENVKIDKALLEEYAEKSKQLTPDQIAAWQYYADQADFNLASLQPVASAQTTPPTPTPEEQSTSATQQQDAQSNKNQSANSSIDKEKAPWYWWVIGAVTLIALYYVLSGRNVTRSEKVTSAPARAAKTRTKKTPAKRRTRK
jgi:hypothetical protein